MNPRARLGRFGDAGARILAGKLLRIAYAADLSAADTLIRKHWVPGPVDAGRERARLKGLRRSVPGLECRDYLAGLEQVKSVPFVFERPDAPHLIRLRDMFGLEKVLQGPGGEYQALLRLGEWLGSRWDHGTDAVPGGPGAGLDAVEVIRTGMQGRKYWCEVAAKVAVDAFTAMGWPTRLATASRDGFTWEHGVAEVWCDQFSKWLALDTDFNVIFEADGVPLSCYELCHDGPDLKRQGRLAPRLLGPPKPSLPLVDLLPYYAYVHIDMRSDWRTRRLRAGSPAGGDLATWWTARPQLGRLLTPRRRVDARSRFDWPVNRAWTRLDGVRAVSGEKGEDGGMAIRASVCAYAPFPARMQYSLDGGEWKEAEGALDWVLAPGDHAVSTRVITARGWAGKAETLHLRLPEPAGASARAVGTAAT